MVARLVQLAAICVSLLSACGRIGFDASGSELSTDASDDSTLDGSPATVGDANPNPDALGNADSDSDGIPDEIDPLPKDPHHYFTINANGTDSLVRHNILPSGQISPALPFGSGLIPGVWGDSLVGDFDGDGVMDVLALEDDPTPELWYFRRGAEDAEFSGNLLGTANLDLLDRLGDFDGDEALDVLSVHVNRNAMTFRIDSVELVANCRRGPLNAGCVVGTGCVFEETATLLTTEVAGQSQFIVGHPLVDLDGDDVLDIVAGTYASGGNAPTTIYLLKGNGGGTFGAPVELFVHNSTGAQAPANSIVIGDFDGDDRTDLLMGFDDDGDAGQAWVYAGMGGTVFNATPIEAFDLNPTEEASSDAVGGTDAARLLDFNRGRPPGVVVGYVSNLGLSESRISAWRSEDGMFLGPFPLNPVLSNTYGVHLSAPYLKPE